MNATMIEMLKNKGFQLTDDGSEKFLTATLSKEEDVAWYGHQISSLKIDVHVLQDGICKVVFFKDHRILKSRCYSTSGKRTFNALAETAACAGFSM